MIIRAGILLVALIVSCKLQAQEDKEVRHLAYLSLLLEEPHSVLYYAKRISKPVPEDTWLQLEAELLADPSVVVSMPERTEKKHTPLFFYLVAVSEFQHRNYKHALEVVNQKNFTTSPATLQGKVEFLKGKSLINVNLPDSARGYLNRALKIFQSDSLTCYVQIAKVHNFLGRASDVLGQPDIAIAHYKHALSILENCPLEKVDDRARIMNNLSIAYKNEGDYVNAQEQYRKTILFKEAHITDSINRANTYINFATFYTEYGNHFNGQQYYDKAIALIDTTQQRSYPLLADYYNNYGLLLMSMREYERATASFQKSLHYHSKANSQPRQFIRPSINLASCLNNGDQPQRATRVLDEGESLVRNLPAASLDRFLFWMTRGAIAYDTKGDSAWHYFWRAKETLERFPKIPERRYTDVLIHLGLSAYQAGRPAQALQYYKQSLARLLSGDMEKNKLITLYNNLGMVYSKSNNQYDSARYYFRLALQENLLHYNEDVYKQPLFVAVFELIATHYNLAHLALRNYEATNKINDLLEALPSIEAGMQLITMERNRMLLSADKIDFSSDVALLYNVAIMVYYHLYKQTGQAKYFENLFDVIERSRQQVMLSSLKIEKIEAFAGVTRKLMNQEQQLGYAIKHLTSQLSEEMALGEDATEELLHEYNDALALQQRKLEKLSDSLKSNLPDYYNLKYNKTTVTLADIKQDILAEKPTCALVQYHIVDSLLVIMVFHKQQQFSLTVPYRGVSQNITQLRNQIYYHLPDWRANAVALHEVLIKPLESLLPLAKIRELIIVPDGELFFLPFEVLLTASGKSLIERTEVCYAFSSTLLWQRKTDRVHDGSSSYFAGFAPVFEKNGDAVQYPLRDGSGTLSFKPLASTTVEVNQIKQVLKKIKVQGTIFEGEQASEEKFKQHEIEKYRYLHLATHGFVNMDNPGRSGVAFSKSSDGEDGILFSDEVYSLKLTADLVCLSACETGLGKIYRGEGLIGLGRGFLYAGAKNLLVSLWSVQDNSTSEWMIAFYSALANGSSNSESVRKAKLKLLKTKTYNHPYFWAPFILVGR